MKFIQIQCVSCNNTATTQTDCLMFALDSDGQVWEKRLQDKVWTKTPIKPATISGKSVKPNAS